LRAWGNSVAGVTQYGVADYLFEGAVVPVGEWVHIVFVKTDGVTKFYQNGELLTEGSFAVDLQMVTLSRDTTNASANDKLTGLLDEAVVYDVALTEEQVASHFAAIGLVAPEPLLPPELPWSVGRNDDGWPAGDGGGPNTSFMQETGTNELPGDPASPEVAQQADDDYYWAGDYSTVIAGNGDYEPVGLVEVNEEAAERAFAGTDNDLRYHFNLPESLQPTDRLTVSYDALNLHTDGQTDARYGIEVYVNNVQVQSEIVIRPDQLGQTYDTEPFTLADVNAEVGLGYDNIITLKGVNYNAEGGGNWMGIDYVQLSLAEAVPAPDLSSGLIAYWPFDGNLGDAVGDSHGEAMGTAEIVYDTGQFGEGIDLDGIDQFVQTPVENEEMFDFQDGTGFTVSAWLRVDGFTKSWQALIAKGEGNRWRVHRRGGENVFTANGGNADVSAGTTDVNDGEIHHIALVSDPEGGEVRFYVDGALEGTSGAPAIQSNDFPMMIGENPDARGRTWDGLIDDVGIWNRPISEEEVALIYNDGAGTVLVSAGGTGLIAHFPLDSDGNSSDGGFTASTVTDVTFGTAGANANTGTSATFNGTSSLIQHDWSADLNPEGSFTLALWARSDGGAGAWHSPVTSRNDKNPDSQGYLIYDNSPSGVWTFWSGNGTVDGNWQALDGPAVDLGEWEHVAIVYDSTAEMKKLYVNGELAVESNDVVAPNDTKPWNIGAGGDIGTAYFFKGDIDDIGLWNIALSQEDIQAVMNQGVVPGDGPAPAPEILIDFAGTGPNSAGASPDPWISINNLVMDEAVDLGGGVTITALDDGFNPNNTASPGAGAEHDGVSVPQEARNDYLFKIADAAGTTARMRIDGLAAGTYNVTVFEGRTTDASQFAKIWTGEEPATENTGDFAKGSATVTVTVGAGESLWYMHLEDGSGGVSGMIIRQAADTPALSIVNNGDGTVTVTFEGKLQGASTVNGPWADVEGAVSPQIIPATEAMQYGRAVSE
jgi:hypothetical protein